MKKLIIVIVCLIVLSTCKKKTSIRVRVFNYAMNEPITDAKVTLIQSKLSGGLFSSGYTCNTIDEKMVDADGYCYFDKEKLRTNSNYQYACKISYAYGQYQSYNCTPTQNSSIEVGKENEKIIHTERFDAYVRVQINNMLSPSISGDSLYISVDYPEYQSPDDTYSQGGGGVSVGGGWHDSPYYPFPSLILWSPAKTIGGKNSVYIRKRKMGVVTVLYDTIKIQPYTTATYTVNW